MKPKMIFLSSSFPYGKGEKTFIAPELDKLIQEYDITLISHADEEDMSDSVNESTVDPGISVLRFDCSTTVFQKILWGLLFFIDREGRREFAYIRKGGGPFIRRMYQSVGFYIMAMKELKQIQRESFFQPEREMICYSYWYTYYCYAFLRLKKKYPNLKVITRTHGIDLYHERMRGMRQPFKQIMDRQLDGVIFAADYAKDYYLKHFAENVEDKKYIVCKLGVPESTITHKQTGGLRLLSCAYAVPLKRIELIIHALSLLQEEHIHWIHIGDGECLEQLQVCAKEELSDKDNITYEFKGYLNSDQIQKVYEEEGINAFITTSSTEGGCPVSIQEAMAHGVPIIGTAVGGITEMIHENGFLLPPDPSKEVVAETISQLYHLEDRTEMEKSSYQIWRNDYNTSVNLEKLVAAIHYLEGNRS